MTRRTVFSKLRALVVGDVMLDRYASGRASRVSPEAPVPVVDVTSERARLGGAANVAANLASLGVEPRLVGLTGRDDAGEMLARLAAGEGIATDLIASDSGTTTVKQRVVARGQQLMRLDYETIDADTARARADALRARAETCLTETAFDVVVCSDYAKGALAEIARVIAAARQRGVPVVVDPKGGDWWRYAGADVVAPNATELAAVAGAWANDVELAEAAGALRQRLSIGTLVVTRSERGLSVLGESEPLHLPASAREVFDVTGAGDTVTALLAAGIGRGDPIGEAAARANRAAGLVVARLGTATVTPHELAAAEAAADMAAIDVDALRDWIRQRRALGERIVMTNGCFDVLHRGHVDYLARARAYGDRLVVAVNDDASVRALKGASRPVNPLADRVAMLRALASVDQVVAFTEPTPAALIEAATPDVLVKGGDYEEQAIAGGDAVRAAGGRVTVIGTRPGYSSSGVIARIGRAATESNNEI